MIKGFSAQGFRQDFNSIPDGRYRSGKTSKHGKTTSISAAGRDSAGVVKVGGPLTPFFNSNKNTWEMKYEYTSTRSDRMSQIPSKNKTDRRINSQETTSDYGTMSYKVDEENLDDLIPALNLGKEDACIFNDVSPEERRERIYSHISEIMSVPRLSEANITQRSAASLDKMRKFLSSENLSDRRSHMGRNSSGSSRGAPSLVSSYSRGQSYLKRSISSPKLDLIPERRDKLGSIKQASVRSSNTTQPKIVQRRPPQVAQNHTRNGFSDFQSEGRNSRLKKGSSTNRKSAGRSQPNQVPGLDLNLSEQSSRSSRTMKKSLRNHGNGHEVDDNLSQEFIPLKDARLKTRVPHLGEDTEAELRLDPPTFGDDTVVEASGQFNSVDDDQFDEDPAIPSGSTGRNFIKENCRLETAKRPDSCATSSSVKAQPKHKPGNVPKYLKARQAQWEEEARAAIANLPDPDCPPGHVRLPDEDRVEQLREMQNTHSALLQEWTMLPVSSDTRRVIEKRAKLETLLRDLDEGIRIYSRPKVFIKKPEEAPSQY